MSSVEAVAAGRWEKRVRGVAEALIEQLGVEIAPNYRENGSGAAG